MLKRPRVLAIVGPFGAGKTALATALVTAHPRAFAQIITHTTRKPRPGERDGVHYHFVAPAAFAKLRDNNDLVEHVTTGAGADATAYGMSKAALADASARARVAALAVLTWDGVDALRALGTVDVRVAAVFAPKQTLRKRLVRDGRATLARQAALTELSVAAAKRDAVARGATVIDNPDGHFQRALDALVALANA